jgi:hypothetical protein
MFAVAPFFNPSGRLGDATGAKFGKTIPPQMPMVTVWIV